MTCILESGSLINVTSYFHSPPGTMWILCPFISDLTNLQIKLHWGLHWTVGIWWILVYIFAPFLQMFTPSPIQVGHNMDLWCFHGQQGFALYLGLWSRFRLAQYSKLLYYNNLKTATYWLVSPNLLASCPKPYYELFDLFN